ncbi:MAG: DUF1508 domain-containing protein [Candidatus Heimdallarchaeota archaeon]|nr:DUF1508 domain-containing protein [Candidatus Heimdallarchaeota archaeon]
MAKIEYYQDKAEEWRWKVIASNGRNIGSCNEGFVNEKNAEDNLKRLANALYEGTQQHTHVKDCIVGMLMRNIKSAPAWYREMADDCLKYMVKNKMPLNFPTAENLLIERIAEFKEKKRKRIIEKSELVIVEDET